MEKDKVPDRKISFPFTAIVGLEKAKLALLCAAVNPAVGGVLLTGEKGSGKSTLIRALANVLPDIDVVAGCPFNCTPHDQLQMCDACYEKWSRGEKLPTLRLRMRVIDMPLSITVDRLAGTLDIGRALKEGIRALQPGLLAEANQNILYVDEVNLLDDYIADVLLDSAAAGWNIVEREGVSVKHPSRFILVGSMNPEEGELRPQILDRFGLSVKIEVPMNPDVRCEIVRRVEEFHADPIAFHKRFEPLETELRHKVARARTLLKSISLSDDLLSLIAKTVVELNIKTSRAEVVTVKVAKAITALEGRTKVTFEEVKRAMDLTLPHRLKAKPFEVQPPRPLFDGQKENNDEEKSKGNGSEKSSGGHLTAQEACRAVFDTVDEYKKGCGECTYESDSHVDFGKLPPVLRSVFDQPSPRGARDIRLTAIGYPHGYTISYVPPQRQVADVDIAATIAIASLRRPVIPLTVGADDLRVRVRKVRAPVLSVLLLDSSGSMAALRSISIAKGIASRLVEEAYIRRSQMALIVFRGSGGEVVVPPTRNYSELISALNHVPTGGRTPLSFAIQTLLDLHKHMKAKCKALRVKAVLISDGKANVPLHGGNIQKDLIRLAKEVKKRGIELTVYDTRPSHVIDPAPSYINLLGEVTGAHVFKM